MKILFLLNKFPTGSETFIQDQISGLKDRNHKATILPIFNDHHDPEIVHQEIKSNNLLEDKIELELPSKFNKNSLNRIYRVSWVLKHIIKSINEPKKLHVLLRSLNLFKYGKRALNLRLFFLTYALWPNNFDIIHSHFGPIGSYASDLKDLGVLNAPLVASFHGYGVRRGQEEGFDIYSDLRNKSDLILANSEETRKILTTYFAENKIKIIPPGVDTEKFSPGEHKENNGEIEILTASRLVDIKRIDIGLEVFSKLEKSISEEISFKIIGDGPERSNLEELSRDLGIFEKTDFKGYLDHDEVAKEMRRSDIFLLTSENEGLGMVLLEAQATGLPVVSSDNGGADTSVKEGKTGYIAGSREEMYSKLENLIQDAQLRESLGKEGREFVVNNFSQEAILDKIEEEYERLQS